MAIERPKPDEVVVKLRQVEVLMGQCLPRIDVIRQIALSGGAKSLRNAPERLWRRLAVEDAGVMSISDNKGRFAGPLSL